MERVRCTEWKESTHLSNEEQLEEKGFFGEK